MATAKKTKKKVQQKVQSNPKRLHELILSDDKTRKKLYEEFGRVRCYMYKTGRTKPNEDTAKRIHQLTGGRVAATAW